MNPVAQLRTVSSKEGSYEALMIWCPGCQHAHPEDGRMIGGLNMLPIVRGGSGSDSPRATWGWNGDLVAVGLEPSILTRSNRIDGEFICHSFLRNGIWQFLGDCTHSLANQYVPMVPLPDWIAKDSKWTST